MYVLSIVPDWLEASGQEISKAWPWILICGLLFGFVGFLWRNFVRPRVKTELSNEIKSVVNEALAPVLHELKPNGGGSIKDQINRIEEKTDCLERMHQETQQTVNRLVADNERQNTAIEFLKDMNH